jgi:hypothetical protein
MVNAFSLFGREKKARGLIFFGNTEWEEMQTMTLLEIEDALTDEEELAQQHGLAVKCSWCGEIIRLDGNELALAMCEACYDRMLAEFLRAQQMNQPFTHASDR